MFPGGDPFTHMFGMMNEMNGMMNQTNQIFQDPFFGMPQAQAPPQAYNQLPQTAPRVEEVPHDAPAGRGAGAAAAGPIVEEPEDDGGHAHSSGAAPQYRQQPHAAPQPQQPPAAAPDAFQDPFGMQLNPFGGMFGGMFGNMMGGMAAGAATPGQVYSYSSSTVMRSGPNGVYHSSTTSRHAPGGVRETQKTIRDGRTGTESMTIARGMGEQERVVTRTRDATGQLITEEHHAGIDPSSAHHFDQQWTQRAQQTMPHWMQQPNTTQRIGPGGRQQQQQLALPSGQASAQQYGQQQQQQYYYQQQGGAGGHVQQQGMGYGQRQQGHRSDSNGSGWSGGYHV